MASVYNLQQSFIFKQYDNYDIKICQFQNLLGFLKSKFKTIKNPSSIDCPSFKSQSSAELNKSGTEEN